MPADGARSSSHDLLLRAGQGDASARDGFCARYRGPLVRWARGRLPGWARERVDTEDIVQDVLVGTLNNLERFEIERPGAIESYLRQAVANRVKDEVRRFHINPGGHVESGADEPIDGAPSPLVLAIGRETAERFEHALGALTEEARGLVIARFELEMSYAEIADTFGKPTPDAARMAVSRAVVTLATAMAGRG